MVQLMISAILLLALSENAQAHFVWLERDGEGPARAYFGEWIDDIREKTGGLLDRFKAPRAFLGTSNDLLPVQRNENNLEFTAKGARRRPFRRQQRPTARGQGKRRRHQNDLLRQSRSGGNRRQARLRAGADDGQRQYLRSGFSRSTFAQGPAYHHRPAEVGKAAGHRRTGTRDAADVLGRALRTGSHPLRRESRRQRG